MRTEHPIRYPHTDAEIAANPWLETTEDEFYDALGAVPPARQSGTAFALGEPACDTHDGRVVHEMYVEVDGRFYRKPCTLASFNPRVYAAEINGLAAPTN